MAALHFSVVKCSSISVCYTTRYCLWRSVYTFKHCTVKVPVVCHEISIVLPGPGWRAGVLCRYHHNSPLRWSIAHCTWNIMLSNRVQWSIICRMRTPSLILGPIQMCSSILCSRSVTQVLWLLWYTEVICSTSSITPVTPGCPSSIQ